jgi:trk system potassium uptake protein TrkA
MKVAICGAGIVGTFLAKDLSKAGHEILLLEKNEDVIKNEMFDNSIEVKIADACEVSSLTSAHFESVDVVVAATGEDEDNLVISLLSKQEFAVPRVVARVNHPENLWLFNESWGVDIAISTPHLLSAVVEEAVNVGTLVRLLQFEGGNARLVEVTLAENSPAVDKNISDLGIPRDATVVAIVRGQHLVVPHGDTILATGDEVLVLVTANSEAEVQNIFIGQSN